MKNLTLLLLLLAGFTFVSCSDDEVVVTPTPVETPFITATVADVAFEATDIEAVGDDSLGELVIFSSGTNAAGDISISLIIPATVPLNESNEIDASDFALAYGTDDPDATYFTVGTLTVTALDTATKSMRGTFDFTATNSDDEDDVVTVTGGSFFVEYE